MTAEAQRFLEAIAKYNTYITTWVELANIRKITSCHEEITLVAERMQQTLQNWEWAGIWKPVAKQPKES